MSLNPEVKSQPDWGSISIDELNPVFNHQDSTVLITSEYFANAMQEGTPLTVASNEHPENSTKGQVLKIDKTKNTLLIKLLD